MLPFSVWIGFGYKRDVNLLHLITTKFRINYEAVCISVSASDVNV